MNVEIRTTPMAPPPRSGPAVVSGRAHATLAPGLEGTFLAEGAGRKRLAQLTSGEALCVTTGQQPGLLTGPLYSVYKAMSAVAYAKWLEAVAGRPVVPVFWVAGDDHDFAEANHVNVLSVTNEVRTLVLRERASADAQAPLYREHLGQNIQSILEAVGDSMPETEFKGEVMGWLARHWTSDTDFATAFATSIAHLLREYGLVVFQSTTREAKQAAAPHLLAALEAAGELDAALETRAQELTAAGEPTPVTVGDGATLVMVEAAAGRDRLVLQDDGGFVTRRSGERFTFDDLQAIARDDPTRLSSNVLLRPVVEAALLPTLCYVGGPGELGYLPQCTPIYNRLGVVPQTPVPRWSGQVIEAKIAKVLAKYDISVDAVGGPEGQLEASIAKESMPMEAEQALAVIRQSLGSEYARLEQAAIAIDPTMKKAVNTTRNAALAGVADLEKRLIAHLKKRNEIVGTQIAKVTANLLPLGRPQERVFSVWHYLVRYGPPFLDQILEHASRWIVQDAATAER